MKKLKDCTASNDFMREADIMGTLNNPCILRIFGLVQDKSSGLMMVQELMICSVLEKLWQSPNEVTENHLKLWASQIALGMQHMEEQKIVHRDLAARNVLLASMHQVSREILPKNQIVHKIFQLNVERNYSLNSKSKT